MGLGWKELVIVLAIVLLVFGTKRLASIGSDLGGAIKGFKKGMKDENAKSETLDQKKPDSDNQA